MSEQDRAKYASAAATLVSATNDPRSDSQRTGWWGFKTQDTTWKDPPPPLDSWKYPEVTRADLERYLQIVGHGRVEQFHQDRGSLAEGLKQQQLLEGEGAHGISQFVLLLPQPRVPSKGMLPALTSNIDGQGPACNSNPPVCMHHKYFFPRPACMHGSDTAPLLLPS